MHLMYGVIRSIGTTQALIHKKVPHTDRKFVKCVQIEIGDECLIFKAGRDITAKRLAIFNIGDQVLVSFEVKGKVYSGFQQTYLKLCQLNLLHSDDQQERIMDSQSV